MTNFWFTWYIIVTCVIQWILNKFRNKNEIYSLKKLHGYLIKVTKVVSSCIKFRAFNTSSKNSVVNWKYILALIDNDKQYKHRHNFCNYNFYRIV